MHHHLIDTSFITIVIIDLVGFDIEANFDSSQGFNSSTDLATTAWRLCWTSSTGKLEFFFYFPTHP
jgi:hypothetical protein